MDPSYALEDCKPVLSYLHLELYLCKSSEIQLRTLLLVLNKNKFHFSFVILLLIRMTAISTHRAELHETDGAHKVIVHGWLYLSLC